MRGQKYLRHAMINEAPELIGEFNAAGELKIVFRFFVAPDKSVRLRATHLKAAFFVRHEFKDQRYMTRLDAIAPGVERDILTFAQEIEAFKDMAEVFGQRQAGSEAQRCRNLVGKVLQLVGNRSFEILT